MKTVHLIYRSCPSCKEDIREGVIRCFTCGTWLYWTAQKVEVRKNAPKPPLNGRVKFRPGTKSVVVYTAKDSLVEAGTLKENQQVTIKAFDEDVYQLADDTWVHQSHIEIRVPISTGQKIRYGVVNALGQDKSVIDKPTWPANIVRPLHEGEILHVLGELDGHLKLNDGWVYQGYVTVTSAVIGKVVPDAEGMSVIDKPTWPANIVRSLKVGEPVQILGEENNHFRIADGYVMKDFISL